MRYKRSAFLFNTERKLTLIKVRLVVDVLTASGSQEDGLLEIPVPDWSMVFVEGPVVSESWNLILESTSLQYSLLLTNTLWLYILICFRSKPFWMSDHLSFSSKDSLALSSGVKLGLMDGDVSFDLFCSRVLTSAERRNLTIVRVWDRSYCYHIYPDGNSP